MFRRSMYHRLTIIGKRSLASLIALCMLFSFAPTVFSEGIELTEEVITDIIPEVTETEAAEEVTALSEITEMRDEFSKTFLMSDGTYTQVSYASPVHYEDEDGVFQEIDNRLSVNAMTGKITTGNGGTDVAFSQSQPQVSIDANGHNISWSVSKKEALQNNDNVSLMNISPSYAPFTANSINVADTADFKALPAEEQLMSAHKAFSEMKYASLAEGYAVNYTVAPGKVKEDILITSAVNNEFVITVNAMGLTATLGDYRTVIFKNNANETVLTFDVPYMYDANDEFSTDIDITLTPILGGYEITLTADEEWLNDEARVYPVVIDPSYTFEHGGAPATTITDTMVHEGDSATNCSCGLNHDTNDFIITNKYNSKQYYSYFKVEVNSSAAMSRVIEATLNLHLTSTTNSGGPFNLYRVTEAWNEATITYDNQPSHSSTAVDSKNYTVNSNGTVTVKFDIAEELRKYTAGIYENYGFMLAYTNQSTNDYNRFRTVDYATVAHRPTMTVNYDIFVTTNGGSYKINNNGSYKFLHANADSLGTGIYYPDRLPSSLQNSGLEWTVYEAASYSGYCIIKPEGFQQYALCDTGTAVELYDTTTGTIDENCHWNIFYYNGYYTIRNRATGRFLYSNGTTVSAVTTNNSNYSRWQVGYTTCSSISVQNITAEPNQTISYTSLNITLNNGTSTPTNANTFSIYDISISSLASYGNTGISIGSEYGVAQVTLSRKDTTASCVFYILIPEYDGIYYFMNVKSSLYMQTVNDAIPEGMQIVQQGFAGADSQKWEVRLHTNGYYTIKNVHSGLYIGIENDSNAQNAKAKQYSFNELSDGQYFKIDHTTSGNVKVSPYFGESVNKVLALDQTSDSEPYGAEIQQRNYIDDTNRKDEWILVKEIHKLRDTESLFPESFSDLIDQGVAMKSDLHFTSDGFYMLNKSISDILDERGITELSSDDLETVRSCSAYYDDWYPYAVKGENDFTYGLLKMREWEWDDENGISQADGDEAGVSISFIKFDITKLLNCINHSYDENLSELLEDLKNVIEPESAHHNDDIKAYFTQVNSVASYLIADLFVNKIILENGDHEGHIRFREDTLNDEYHNRVENYISNIEDSLERDIGFINSNDHQINIIDINNPTYYEKIVILAVGTGDISYNMFAAEVKFHADFLNSFLDLIEPINPLDTYIKALKADMSLSDNEFSFAEVYHDPEDNTVTDQRDFHGGW